jgi:hypothetical protein
MKIKYTGKRRIRIVGEHEWNAANDFVQEVSDQEMIEDLLTDPFNEFEELAEDYQPPKKKRNWNKEDA